MGAVRAILDETTHELKVLGWWGELNLEGTRRAQASPYRYCLQGNNLYLPKDNSVIDSKHKLCWLRFRVEIAEELPDLGNFDSPLPYTIQELDAAGVGIGSHYAKRHREIDGKRTVVSAFCSQELIDSIAKNPEVLDDVSKANFEALAAEVFARNGFEVDLYRPIKDEGIDFLAIKNEEGDPFILAVQVKHPDKPDAGEKRNRIQVPTVREIYGVSKYYGLDKAVVVTSSEFSRGAKAFQAGKPDEIQLLNREELLAWLLKYRWNPDE